MRVEDVMSTDVVTVSPDTSLKRVAELLVLSRVSGLPVVDAGGSVLGVVSGSDILHKEREPAASVGFLGRLLRRNRDAEAKQAALTAAGAMTSPPVTAHPQMPLSQAATLMLERSVDRLVVVKGWSPDGNAEDTTLVGIVTRGDCVRAFTRPDEEIANEIRDIAGQYGMLLPEVDVAVDRGEVTLRGEVDHRVDAQGLADAAARVPGVVSVTSNLSWRVDESQYAHDRSHLFGY
jgi:CBS domain-containing protein